MKLIFAKSNWEVPELPLEAFLGKARQAGFDAVEIYLPARNEDGATLRTETKRHGLQFIAQISSQGVSPKDHLETLERNYLRACGVEPLAVNSHTGRDIFSFEQNLEIFALGEHLVERHGVPLLHETHRGRALYNGPDSAKFLREIETLRITADFSHWFCVHENDLADQPENTSLAVARAHHIHARVGHSEGPQVTDPFVPESAGWLGRHLSLWREILKSRNAAGAQALTLTPEFGPEPYLTIHPETRLPLADPWTLNCRMRDYLQDALSRGPR